MKKLFFVFMASLCMGLASCNNCAKVTTEDVCDSTAVDTTEVVDTVAVDSVLADSVCLD